MGSFLVVFTSAYLSEPLFEFSEGIFYWISSNRVKRVNLQLSFSRIRIISSVDNAKHANALFYVKYSQRILLKLD